MDGIKSQNSSMDQELLERLKNTQSCQMVIRLAINLSIIRHSYRLLIKRRWGDKMHTLFEILSKWTAESMRVFVIRAILIVPFAIAIQSQANLENEIWLHDAKIGVVAKPSWIILSHHPFGATSRLDLQLIDDSESEEVCIYTKLIIKTYDLPNKTKMTQFSRDILSKPKESVIVTNFQGWIIMSWYEDVGGVPYKKIEARALTKNGSSGIGIISHLEWRVLEDLPKDYDQKMSATLKSVISQIRTESSIFTADPPPRGAGGSSGSEKIRPLIPTPPPPIPTTH